MADPDAAKAVLDELIAARPEDFPWLPTWLQGLLELGSEFTDECQVRAAPTVVSQGRLRTLEVH